MPGDVGSTDTVHPWLKTFRPQDRPMIRAWFGYAVSQGAARPEAIVELVQRLVSAKLEWSVSPTSVQVCEGMLASLVYRRGAAIAYAKTLLAEGRRNV